MKAMFHLSAALGTILWLATPAAAQQATAPSPRDRLIAHLTRIADEKTQARAATVAAIATPEEARRRQVRVRALLSEMIQFEHAAGPVRFEVTGRSTGEGYRVENLWYESLPGYRVTANLYLPEGKGPFPAIITQPGHGVDGRLSGTGFAVNLARTGFVVLAIDIVGEGERIQFYDPEIGASKVGRPTGEHSMAFGQALPTGGHVSRFFIQDAMRGVDLLMQRDEVDDQRIGAFGCSGGGTMTAYLAALDPRIKATATACYINDFDHLLGPGGPGAQDAEQSIPFFLDRGLDIPDWVEAAAPRPYAIVSTTEDMFPIAGARAAYAEARRFYDVMGAADKITMIEGPGPHGNLGPIAPRIIGFFNRWLKDAPGEPALDAVPAGDPSRLWATSTGQLVTSGGGDTLHAMIAREIPTPPIPVGEMPAARLERLRVAIRDITRAQVKSGATVSAVSEGTPEARSGYTLTNISFHAAPDLDVDSVYARAGTGGKHPTMLFLSSQPLRALSAPGGLLEHWTQAGWNVLAIEPAGSGGTEEIKSVLTGDWTLLSLRALLVGETPVGIRADDALTALNWLAARPEVDARALSVYGTGALAPVALHVGVLDPRVASVTADGGILSYRDFVLRPISRDMAEVNLPGVLARYDLPDLIAALGSKVTLVSPVNSVGEPLKAADVATILSPSPRLIMRGARDPILPPSSR
ncbi:acetylxylan esterase [Sphingopyxis sp.]|uniref:alpha/beta hydrolase n=1 Tax=Sphingopyxis sp. TaxID=1908224 RepID=UPI002617CB06|nr:acetylxylan esterase [Sphingopyxis sp.]MCW0199719.1 acetylxylan esterase [Sphingopyxis sp.]